MNIWAFCSLDGSVFKFGNYLLSHIFLLRGIALAANNEGTQTPGRYEHNTFEISEFECINKVNDDLILIQRTCGLTFGTDALLLAAFVRPSKNAVAAEFGGGSGIVSLLCAVRNKAKLIYSVEVQSEYAELIGRNAMQNGLSEKVIPVHADLRDLTPDILGCELDTVITNPPYMRTDSGKPNESAEKNIARHEVFGTIFDFCSSAAKLLRYGGSFYCVYRPDRLTDLISACRESKLEPKRAVFVHPDTASPPSLVLIEAKKGAAPSMHIAPPLIIYKDGSRDYTEQVQRMYETGNL